MLPSMVTQYDVVKWRNNIIRSPANPNGVAETSWNNYARHLSALYNFGLERRLLGACDANPFKGVRVREPRKPKKILHPDVVGLARRELNNCRIYEEASRKPSSLHPAWFWEVVVETFYFTGIRLNQLLNIQAQHVDLKRCVLVGSAEGAKNHAEFILPIPDRLHPLLSCLMSQAFRTGIGANEQLFNVNRYSHRHRRKVMNKSQVSHFFDRLSEVCGARVTPHRFRHTLGTDLMEDPERNLHLTQQILAHSDIRSTLEYVHPKTETLRQLLNQR
ncbi:site-specific integrase [Salinicola corii]|uniref:Site-specific integrase n=1 Tax=Salinicola corii TaxID=2606937 RepID=A0A640WCM8_9GAMM|nr:site-specific integrase [Salinicola corii]